MTLAIHHNLHKTLQFAAALLLALVVAWPVQATVDPETVPQQAADELLRDRAVQFMQIVNQARRNPLASAARLELNQQQVRTAFADSPWILNEGLPPLAWNEQLVVSAGAHTRDMFARLYYAYVNPEGDTVEQRIAATGYRALFVGETMNALFFDNFVALDKAFQLLVDTILRDELTGNPSVERNIFSPDVSEIGVSFRAESIRLLDDQPYVYLLLADFAEPLELRQVVQVEHDPDSRVVVRSFADNRWIYPESLRPGLVQMPLPSGGGEIYAVTGQGLGEAGAGYALAAQGNNNNLFLDLRTASAASEL